MMRAFDGLGLDIAVTAETNDGLVRQLGSPHVEIVAGFAGHSVAAVGAKIPVVHTGSVFHVAG